MAINWERADHLSDREARWASILPLCLLQFGRRIQARLLSRGARTTWGLPLLSSQNQVSYQQRALYGWQVHLYNLHSLSQGNLELELEYSNHSHCYDLLYVLWWEGNRWCLRNFLEKKAACSKEFTIKFEKLKVRGAIQGKVDRTEVSNSWKNRAAYA